MADPERSRAARAAAEAALVRVVHHYGGRPEFVPDNARIWRWVAEGPPAKTVVKFELVADLDDQPNEAIVDFDACEKLGAVNLRGRLRRS